MNVHKETIPDIYSARSISDVQQMMTEAVVKMYRRSQFAEETGTIYLYKVFRPDIGGVDLCFVRTADPTEADAIKLFNNDVWMLTEEQTLDLFIKAG